MNTLLKYSGLVALIILAIFGLSRILLSKSVVFGTAASCSTDVTCFTKLAALTSFQDDGTAIFNSTFQLGSSGTVQTNQITTTCAAKADNSITATTTGYAYCTGVTGVTSADNIIAQFATSTAGYVFTTDNFYVVSAKASSTAGAIDLLVYNGTGKTQAPSVAGRTASTTVIWASH